MPNIVHVTCENPDEILNAGAYGAGALIRLQSAATEAGAFTDVAGTGSTPTIAVVDGVRSYTGYDPNGTSSTWYRTRYENAAGSRLSDWTPPFQVAPEGSGLLCSLYDAKQRLGIAPTDKNQDEDLLEIIRQVSTEIMDYTGRLFARSPMTGTVAELFEVPEDGSDLWIPQGIAEVSEVAIATSTQPSVGGTYTVVPTAEWFLRPLPGDRSPGWPATRIVISDLSAYRFYKGFNAARITLARGWPTVPSNISAVALRATVTNHMSKGVAGGGPAIVGPSGAMTILRDISPKDQMTLDRYRVPSIG